MRTWIAVLLVLAAVAVMALWKVRVMVAGGRALLALLVLAVVGMVLLAPRDDRR